MPDVEDGSVEESAGPVQQPVPSNPVEKTRAWTGLLVVICGDAVIGVAAIFGVVLMAQSDKQQIGSVMVSILSSAFTAIGTMTTAYFGIRAASNTAQSSMTDPTQLATSIAMLQRP